MIDLEILRSDPDRVRAEIQKRHLDGPDVGEVLKRDKARRTIITKLDEFRVKLKAASDVVASAKGDARDQAVTQAKKLSADAKALEPDVKRAEAAFMELAAKLPTFAHESVPVGASADDNEVQATKGEKPTFDFAPKPHYEIAEKLGILDAKRAARVSGSRFHYAKGDLVLLQWALHRFVMDELTQRDFVPMLTPTLVNAGAMFGAGMFPVDTQEVYSVPADKLYLIGTSEITLVNYHAGETLDIKERPIMYSGFTTNYRREAGAAGKDTRGMIRGHQFDKLEMFVFASQETSWDILDKVLLPTAEGILEKLRLHFRRVVLATGDLPYKMQKTYDVEVWMPAEQRYVEVGSISNAGDFQARRLGIKYINNEGEKRFAHTLNGTAAAFSRLPAAIIENFQEADGRVRIPEVLQSHFGNKEYLEASK